MIAMPAGVRVWLANGHAGMRRGMGGLALQVQQALGRDPQPAKRDVCARGRRDRRLDHGGLGWCVHSDDTTVPVQAKGKTVTGRLWAYVRDDQPFGGPAPPAAVFHYSRDRRGEHPSKHLAGYAGILQADAYAGFNDLYQGPKTHRCENVR